MPTTETKSYTPIESLHNEGVVPDWMAKDCEKHGIYEAKNILCEWHWEDSWYLGDGYDRNKLEVLARVRNTIHAALGY